MNGKQLFDVGARLLAVWFIVSGIAGLPQALDVYSPTNAALFDPNNGGERALFVFLAVAGNAVFVVSGLVLLIRHPPSADPARLPSIDSNALLVAGMRLLGLALALRAALSLFVTIVLAFIYPTTGAAGYVAGLGQALTCACGLILLLRSTAIMRLIARASAAPAVGDETKITTVTETSDTNTGVF